MDEVNTRSQKRVLILPVKLKYSPPTLCFPLIISVVHSALFFPEKAKINSTNLPVDRFF